MDQRRPPGGRETTPEMFRPPPQTTSAQVPGDVCGLLISNSIPTTRRGNRSRFFPLLMNTPEKHWVNQFYSLSHAKGIIGIWKEDYNTIKPHSSLKYLAPAVYAEKCTH